MFVLRDVPCYPAMYFSAVISGSLVVQEGKGQTKKGLCLVIHVKQAQTDWSCVVSYHLSTQLHCVGSCVIAEDQGQALRRCL